MFCSEALPIIKYTFILETFKVVAMIQHENTSFLVEIDQDQVQPVEQYRSASFCQCSVRYCVHTLEG